MSVTDKMLTGTWLGGVEYSMPIPFMGIIMWPSVVDVRFGVPAEAEMKGTNDVPERNVVGWTATNFGPEEDRNVYWGRINRCAGG